MGASLQRLFSVPVLRRGSVAALVLLLAGGYVATSARASFPGGNGQINFRAGTPSGSSFYSADPVGGTATPVTETGEWSADGLKQVRGRVSGENDFDLRLVTPQWPGGRYADLDVPDPDGNQSAINSPAWSRDGNHIVFMASGNNADGDEVQELYSIGENGAELTKITDVGPDGRYIDDYPTWSPTADRIVFVRYDREANEEGVWVVDPDGSNPQKLTPGNQRVAGRPSWSPDGQWVSYSTSDGQSLNIYKVREDGSQVVQITVGVGRETNPVWSPDGSEIVYTIEQGNRSDLFVANVDGSNEQRLTSGGQQGTWFNIEDVSWRPVVPQATVTVTNGQAVFSAAPGQRDVLTVAPNGSKVRFLRSEPIEAGAGCNKVTAYMVDCDSVTSVWLELRDGDDAATVGALGRPLSIWGGSGDDRLSANGGAMLVGGPDKDTIWGGNGTDIVVGCAGSDTLYGGNDNDLVTDWHPYICADSSSNDTLDGGGGSDLMYAGGGFDKLLARDQMPNSSLFWSDSVNCEGNPAGAPDIAQINTAPSADVTSGCELLLP